MTTTPTIEDWTRRELVNATIMNRRVRDVHLSLAKSPAAIRLVGQDRTGLGAGTYAVGTFAPIAGTADSYATQPSMAALSSGTAWGVVAPVAGRYRFTVGGYITATTAQAAARTCYVAAAINATNSGSAIGAAAFMTFPLTNYSTTIHSGCVSTEIALQANDTVRVAGYMDGSGWTWNATSFIELRWIGA